MEPIKICPRLACTLQNRSSLVFTELSEVIVKRGDFYWPREYLFERHCHRSGVEVPQGVTGCGRCYSTCEQDMSVESILVGTTV